MSLKKLIFPPKKVTEVANKWKIYIIFVNNHHNFQLNLKYLPHLSGLFLESTNLPEVSLFQQYIDIVTEELLL